MTAEVVNLRLARKSKQRATKAAVASENRTRFGRSKAEKALASRERERTTKFVDGHALQKSAETDADPG